MSSTQDLSVQQLLDRINALKHQINPEGGSPDGVVATSTPLPSAATASTALVPDESPAPVRRAHEILRDLQGKASDAALEIAPKTLGVGKKFAHTSSALSTDVQSVVSITMPIGVALEKGIQAMTISTSISDDEEEQRHSGEVMTETPMPTPPVADNFAVSVLPSIRIVDPSEGQRIVSNMNFVKFLNASSDKTTRLLNASSLVDVMALATDSSNAHTGDSADFAESHAITSTKIQSYCNSNTRHRHVYDMVIPKKENGRIFACYGRKMQNESVFDSLGLVALWNLLRNDEPERELQYRGALTALAANPFNPDILVAGDDSGAVVQWDLRSRSPLPSSWTTLEASGHQMPVQAITHTGSAQAYQITSLDAEGRLCSWRPASLAKPALTVDINRPIYSSSSQAKLSDVFPTITPTVAITNPHEGGRFTIGCFDGTILEAMPAEQMEGNDGINNVIVASSSPDVSLSSDKVNAYGHTGCITALSWLTDSGGLNLPRLLLSGALDGQVHMWHAYSTNKESRSLRGVSSAYADSLLRRPVFSYSYQNFVTSLSAHPTIPGVFACASGSFLDIWSVGGSTAIPASRVNIDDKQSTVTKLVWSEDGSRLWSGSLGGSIDLYGTKFGSALNFEGASTSFENAISGELEKIRAEA